jgi:hypothetical protein
LVTSEGADIFANAHDALAANNIRRASAKRLIPVEHFASH